MPNGRALALLGIVACAATFPSVPRGTGDAGPTVRIALTRGTGEALISATGSWRAFASNGGALARGEAGEEWAVEQHAGLMRAVRKGGAATGWVQGPIVVRPTDDHAFVTWNQRRFRGELHIALTDTGLLAVNRLPLEDYLRGVVPLEIGRAVTEQAAVEAQAIAARSFTRERLRATAGRAFDLLANPNDQVYGGAGAETPVGDAAVVATSGLVLTYAGRVVSAPYHAMCGGTTAEPPEVWRAAAQPFLKRVSDTIPGSDRTYCGIAPRFRWERSFDGSALSVAVDRYIRRYVSAPGGSLGAVRNVVVTDRTPSGRVATVDIDTERGVFTLRGNDARYVLRSPAGELLPSNAFSPEAVIGRGGRLTQLTLRGVGNGHGVGMCQWGAIGRARLGQNVRTILSAYYPGATVGRVD